MSGLVLGLSRLSYLYTDIYMIVVDLDFVTLRRFCTGLFISLNSVLIHRVSQKQSMIVENL